MFKFQNERYKCWYESILCVFYSRLFMVFSQRKREVLPMSFEESERRALLHKQWSRFKYPQHFAENKSISEALQAQETALNELRAESEDLYIKAISVSVRTTIYITPAGIKGHFVERTLILSPSTK